MTDELSRDETGKIKKTYRLHASNDHTEEMAFAYEIHCPKCGNHPETDWETADIKYTWTL